MILIFFVNEETIILSSGLADVPYNYSECNSTKDNRNSLLTLLENPPRNCKSNFFVTDFLGSIEQFQHMPPRPELKDRYVFFSYTFEMMERTEVKEYLVYDTIGMISSVGGTLGLFLGFSFFSLISDILDAIGTTLRRKIDVAE